MASSSGWFNRKGEKKKAKGAGSKPGEIVMTKVLHTGAEEAGPLEISTTGIVSAVAMAIACLSADASAQEHGLRKLVNLARNVSSDAKNRAEEAEESGAAAAGSAGSLSLLAEAIPLVVPLLESSFPVIQMFATFALVYLAEDRANQAAIRDLNAIPLLAPLLGSHNTEIVEKVIWLFTILSQDRTSRAIMVREGVVGRLCSLLSTPNRWDQLMNGFCILLRNLFFEVEHQDRFAQEGGVQILMNLPILTSPLPSLQLHWTMLLAILSFFRPAIRTLILDSGAVSTLVTLLSTSEDDQVRSYATQSLTNLSFDVENVEGIMNSGAGRPLFNIFRSAAASPKVADSLLFEHILTALTNLAMTDDDIIAIFLEDESSLSQLLDICAPKSPFNQPIRLRATQFLVTLARFERARRVLLELGALPNFQTPVDQPSGAVLDILALTQGSPPRPEAPLPEASPDVADASDPVALHSQLLAARGMVVHNLNIPFSAEFKKTIASLAERPDPKPTTQRDPHEQHRMRVINEILETEKNYVANLLVVCKVYEEALAELPPKTKGMVTVDERRSMFKMFDYLYHAHQDFLQSLQKSVFEHHKDQSKKLGPVFLELASCLKSYRVFMNNYETASNILAAALKRPAFAAWAEQQEEKFKTKSLPNLLIEPIQRIPRYLLLLNEILKKMEPVHVDYADFTNAFSQIEEAANFLEAEKDKAVHKSKLIELQGQIKGLTAKNIDLTAFSWRRFIRSGQLLLESGKSKMSEYVHFFLLSDLLIVGAEKKSEIHLIHVLELKNIIVSNLQNDVDEGDERNAFQILTDKVNLIVSTTKASERSEWLSEFKRAITDIKAHVP